MSNYQIFQNLYKAKYHLAFMLGSVYVFGVYMGKRGLKHEIFGLDGIYYNNIGNGGPMLDIYTTLTDQEMAALKFQRRATWHGARLGPNHLNHTISTISDQELQDRGINWPKEPYVEYLKRPPHDFYL